MARKRTSGIYKIQNTVNGKIYVGKSTYIEHRFRGHRSQLKRNKHPNSYLQASWNKYGENAFVFEILEICTNEQLTEKEIFWMKELSTLDREEGYNFREDNVDGTISKATRKKISISRKKWHRENRDQSTSKKVRVVDLNTMKWRTFESITEGLEYHGKSTNQIPRHVNKKPYGDLVFITVDIKDRLKLLYKIYLHWVKKNSGYYTGVRKTPFYAYNIETKEYKEFYSKQDYVDYAQIEEQRHIAQLCRLAYTKGFIIAKTKKRLIEKVNDYVKIKEEKEKRELLKRLPTYRFYVEDETCCTRYTTTTEILEDNPQFSKSGVYKCLWEGRKTHKGCIIKHIPC